MALVITPPGITQPIRYGAPNVPILEYSVTGNTGTVVWTVENENPEGPNGSITSPGTSAVLTPPNHTTRIIVTATDAVISVPSTLDIEATFPYQPARGIESDADYGVEFSISEQGPPRVRNLADGSGWPLVFGKRQYLEYAAARDFLVLHGKHTPFWIADLTLGEVRKGYRDSAIRRSAHGADWIEYSFRFKDYQYVPPQNIAEVGFYAPEGSYGEYSIEEYSG